MRRPDIVEPVSGLAEWVNPLIIVEKPGGKHRICIDPKHLNQNYSNFGHLSADFHLSVYLMGHIMQAKFSNRTSRK